MNILKAMVILANNDDGTGGEIHKVDVIEYDGKSWLVPEWLDYKDAKVTMPARLVCIGLLRHSRSDGKGWQFVVSDPLPKSVFEGRAPPALVKQYLVIEAPDIRIPIRTVH